MQSITLRPLNNLLFSLCSGTHIGPSLNYVYILSVLGIFEKYPSSWPDMNLDFESVNILA